MTTPHLKLAAVAVAASTVVTVLGVAPAHAANYHYSSCSDLHRVYKHGVAKSKAAAQKQVRAGYGRPAYGKTAQKVYWANYTRLDRDRDGTACEA